MTSKERLKKLRKSKLYNLALKQRVKIRQINITYLSKNFKVVEDNFFETLLMGYEILNRATKRGIKI